MRPPNTEELEDEEIEEENKIINEVRNTSMIAHESSLDALPLSSHLGIQNMVLQTEWLA